MLARRTSGLFLYREFRDFLSSGHENRESTSLLAQNLQEVLIPRDATQLARRTVDSCVAEVRRWLEAGEHRDATASLLEIGHDSRRVKDLDSLRLMMVAKALQSVGLFEASEPFYRTSLQRSVSELSFRPSRRRARAISRARLAIFLGEEEQLANALGRLTRAGAERTRGVAELHALGRISRGEDSLSCRPGWFGDFISQKPILLCGPGPLGDGLPSNNNALAARVLADPLPNFDDRQDPAGGRTDLAYGAGSVGRRLLHQKDAFRQEVVKRFEVLSLPSTDLAAALSGVGNIRVRAYAKPRLFGHGTSFMAVNILWDLLESGAREVYVTGVTGFLGREPYRASQNRRAAHGSKFNRCFEFAKNDVIFNRCVLRILSTSNRVSGDSAFVRMVGLVHTEYLRELDEIYGVNRR